MRILACFQLAIVAITLICAPHTTVAADGIRFADVAISLGDSRSDVTRAILASKSSHSLRGGSDELLTVLDANGRLTANVRFRRDSAVAIESVWTVATAADFAQTLRKVVGTLIGETGSLTFDTNVSGNTVTRLSSGNVQIAIQHIPKIEGGASNDVALLVTIGETRELLDR